MTSRSILKHGDKHYLGKVVTSDVHVRDGNSDCTRRTTSFAIAACPWPVGWNVLAMAMILAPSVPPVYRAMFTIPSVAVENCMACKVYRDVKFGVIQSMINAAAQHSSRSAIPSSHHHSRYGRRDGAKLHTDIDDGIMVKTSMSRTVDPPLELDLVGRSASGRDSSSYERNTESKISGLAV